MDLLQLNENVNNMEINNEKYVDVTKGVLCLKFKIDNKVWI